MDNKTKPVRLFISHSSRDISYVMPLVRMLELLGMNKENMFCSSIREYGVPFDNNIFDYLREQFQDYNLRVLFILSDNYYASAATMNEMGAAWVLQHRYTSILVPKFNYKDIRGAIDTRKISIKLDAAEMELKGQLNGLKDALVSDFNLRSVSQISWERYRDEFIKKVQEVALLWNELHVLREQKSPAEKWIPILIRLVAIAPESADAQYMLGVKYLSVGDTLNAKRYLDEAERQVMDDELRENIRQMKSQIDLKS